MANVILNSQGICVYFRTLMIRTVKNKVPDILNLNNALDATWKSLLAPEFEQDYMRALWEFLKGRRDAGATIYPPVEDWFNAFSCTPFERVKVVILGQDPYHGPGQAHGLCFSVRPGVTPPPSLKNIFRELEHDLEISPPPHGFLQAWAQQGVFLLNSVLTVEQGKPGAHQGKGWERFTDRAVELLNVRRDNIVFMLWGSYALKKGSIVDRTRHLVLEAAHPSPLSAYRGFFGCRHFSQANTYLRRHRQAPIDWRLPPL